jgi:hypothetical protein
LRPNHLARPLTLRASLPKFHPSSPFRWMNHFRWNFNDSSLSATDYPNHTTAELVAMTIQDLKDRRALWHGMLTPERREEILREVFHES